MTKGKKMAFLSVLSASVAIGAVVFTQFTVNNGKYVINQTNADDTYTLTYDKDHKVIDSQIVTPTGYTVWTKVDNASFTTNGLEFSKKFGYIQNLSILKGIQSIEFVGVSGTFELSYGYVEPNDLQTPEYGKATISSDSTISFTEAENPCYFRVQSISSDSSTLQALKINYSCLPSYEPTDPNLEASSDGLENIKLPYSSSQKGVLAFDNVNVCQTDFVLKSNRSLKITNHTKNESVPLIDGQEAIEQGYADGDYLIFDIKSNNSKVGSQSNPFMFTIDRNDGGQSVGWKDPTGYIKNYAENGDGWSRYYWDMKDKDGSKVPLSKITKLYFIPSQDLVTDEYFILDNIHFGEKPVVTNKVVSGKASSTLNLSQTLTVSTDTLVFDIKFNGESDKQARIYFSDNWNSWFGKFKLYPTTKTGDYDGLTVSSLSDGFIRFSFVLKDVTTVEGTTPETVKFVACHQWTDTTGYYRIPTID